MKFRKKFIYVLIIILLLITKNVNAEKVELQVEDILTFTKPEGYNTIQGMTITDKYFVIAVVNETNNTSVFLVYDKATLQEVPTLSKKQTYTIGHVNDMAYYDGKIYISDKNKIYVMNKDTLVKESEIEIPVTGTGIHVDENYYYIRTSTNIILYHQNLEESRSFPIEAKYNPQGISVKGEYILFNIWTGASAVDDYEADTSLINVYKKEGGLNNQFYVKGLGEIEAVEFDGEKEYLLFQKNNEGKIYTPIVKKMYPLNIEIPVVTETIEKEDDKVAKAILKTYDNKEIELTSANGKFQLPEIALEEEGTYKYILTLSETGKKDIEYDKTPIEITVIVEYDASLNQFVGKTSFKNNKDSFEMESIDREALKCQHKEEAYYDNNGHETTKENYEKVCVTVLKKTAAKNDEIENPNTGANLPIVAPFIILSILLVILVLNKNKLYKI